MASSARQLAYILPYAVGMTRKTGLTNCSASFHGAGRPDQYAFDFDTPVGSEFLAIHDGIVVRVEERQPSAGGGSGNYVAIDHLNGTFSLYYHSPSDGIHDVLNQTIKQGHPLSITGRSGLAGYPHLHLIVVKDSPDWPYEGIPISFNNVVPRDAVLVGGKTYLVCDK